MADVITFANQKGGVGKTITISATASILTRRGYRVLLIDQDAQRNLDMVAGANVAISRSDTTSPSILTVLNGECEIRDAIVRTEIGDLVRATNQLYGWTPPAVLTKDEFNRLKEDPERLVSFLEQRFETIGGVSDVNLLRNRIRPVLNDYDYILIDTNPTLTLLTLNAFFASQYVVIPAFSEKSSAEAVVEMYETIRDIRYYNAGLKLEIAGILMTKYDQRTRAGRRHVMKYAKLANSLGIYLFQTKIRASARAAEYVEAKMDIVRYDPNCATSQDYSRFVDELLGRIEQIKEGWKNG